eukprot:GILI01025363.1.p1 GENE.GILI01025363.1~~GILI01025363.1.p1  ORF type:complete len:322 (+),score=99.11 GILI01025363.1:42-1007(+)
MAAAAVRALENEILNLERRARQTEERVKRFEQKDAPAPAEKKLRVASQVASVGAKVAEKEHEEESLRKVTLNEEPGRVVTKVASVIVSRKRPAEEGPQLEDEEEEHDSKRRVIDKSKAVPVSIEERKAELSKSLPEDVKKRSRNLFGSLLLGQLQKAKRNLETETENVRLQRKAEVEHRVEDKQKQTQQDIDLKAAQATQERRARDKAMLAQLDRELTQKSLLLLDMQLAKHHTALGACETLKTKCSPPLMFMPKVHNDKTTRLLEEQREASRQAQAERDQWLENACREAGVDVPVWIPPAQASVEKKEEHEEEEEEEVEK